MKKEISIRAKERRHVTAMDDRLYNHVRHSTKEYAIIPTSTVLVSDGDTVDKGRVLTDDHRIYPNHLHCADHKLPNNILLMRYSIYASQGRY